MIQDYQFKKRFLTTTIDKAQSEVLVQLFLFLVQLGLLATNKLLLMYANASRFILDKLTDVFSGFLRRGLQYTRGK